MSDWVEATADGKKFYYHRVTRVSVWEKPEELKLFEQQHQQHSNGSSNGSGGHGHGHGHGLGGNSSSAVSVLPANWKEYTATENGRKYYHNQVTNETRWDVPTESSIDKQMEGNPASTDDYNNHQSSRTDVSSEKAQSINRFKQLLTDTEVASNWTFERAQRAIMNDERYQALKTMSERKSAFQEYLVERKKYEYEEKKKRDKVNRETFLELLSISPEVVPSMSWRRASLYFDGEPKWDAIENDREREDLFRGYIADMEKQEKETKENERKALITQVKERFEKNYHITINTQWRKIKDAYDEDPLFKQLDKYDILQVFESYIRDLEKKEDDAQRAAKELIKNEARICRDNFRELLNDLYNKGEVHAYTNWTEFYQKYQTSPAFVELSSQIVGSTPPELYSDFKEELEERYEKDFKRLKNIVQDVNFQIQPNSTIDQLQSSISSHEKYNTINPIHTVPFFEYLKEREERKAKESLKRKQRSVLSFKALLEDTRVIDKHSKWQDIRPVLARDSAFDSLDSESEREKIFNEYLIFLSKEESDEEGVIKSDEDLSSRKEFSSKKRQSDQYDERKKKESKY